MANEEHLAKVKEGVEAWNRWREDNRGISPDLREAKLSKADLRNADLRLVNLFKADLSRANLGGTNFRLANLGFATLCGTDLPDTDFTDADLHHADLRHAKLSPSFKFNRRGADLTRANLRRADLEKAVFGHTTLADLDLSETKGLDTVQHRRPSPISTSTLEKSRGQIPVAFLKGCGLSDWQIEAAKLYNRELAEDEKTAILYEISRLQGESPIQVNPLFISYSHSDTAFVEVLENRLDWSRIRYWRDVHDLTAGPLEAQIEHAIQVNPTFVLVLTENSVESDWVEWEAGKARELEKDLRKRGEERHVLCPLALDRSWEDADWSGPLRNQIQKYNILDFSRWQEPGGMDEPFQKLLDGLKIFYPGQVPRERT